MKYFNFEANNDAFTVAELATIFNKLVEEGCGKATVDTYDWAVGTVSVDEKYCTLKMK